MPRIGGKKFLRKTICEAFPQPERFNRYIEVFGGMAWVMLYKEKHADMEVYNDADGELVNLMRCVKFHLPELMRELEGFLNSREMFTDAISQLGSKGLTDIQKAARYFIKMRLSFGANGREFSCSPKNIKGAIDKMEAVREGFSRVVIENKDYDNLIKVYDRQDALFYCDPPYHKTEDFYDVAFCEADHIRLKDRLSSIKGLFLLSYNDDEFVRELYRDYNIRGVERANNLITGKYKEVIITNY
ncbi:MAG: DNA adenine methylase [Oscillospiraceae bacterium]|jgi:DNA adenine methylase|nr:DNA adenine methylase [Oscillospiraceae bacterium]